MKCIIVDDEPLARSLMESYINRVEGLVIVKSCSNAMDAFATLRQKHIDLIFLDIHMPQINGLELLRSLKDRPKVILTTAYREHASEAYDLDVIDYLLKPVSFERFLRGVSKLTITQTPETNDDVHAKSFDEAYLYLRADREMVKVFLKDILYIESLRDYVRVKTLVGQVVTYQKISFLEKKLPENKFARVHRSFVVALDKISSFTYNSVKLGDLEIPIGRIYKQQAMKVLNQHNALM